MKSVISLLFLFVIIHLLFAKDVNTLGDESPENMFYTTPKDSVELIDEQKTDSSLMSLRTSCINSLVNQTITSKVSAEGCSVLTVQNVVVTNVGDLTLSAPLEIIISGVFEIQEGGVLNINFAPVLMFNYDYDASGNRIARSFNIVSQSANNETSGD